MSCIQNGPHDVLVSGVHTPDQPTISVTAVRCQEAAWQLDN